MMALTQGDHGPDKPGRRQFLKVGAGAAAGIVGMSLAPGRSAQVVHAEEPYTLTAVASDGRSYVAGKFMLALDGVNSGWLQSVEGGNATADVVSESASSSYYVKKHIGNLRYEDILIELGFAMTPGVYDWINASWQANYQRKNGTIIAADYQLEAKSQREFFNALITETTIPACDASSKDPAYLTLKIAPEYTRQGKASRKVGEASKKDQKLWVPSNFRLEIDGLDCTKVAKIDAFTVKQGVSQDDVGDQRDYLKEPGKIEFPNLAISLLETGAQTWYDWFEDFVIKGNSTDDKEKTGSLTFLSPNQQDELLTITFSGLGIFRLSDDKAEANADRIKRIKAELYCERMEFKYGGNVVS